LVQYLIHSRDNYAGAKRALRASTRKLYFTAYQSYLFNLALAKRMETAEGDLGRFYEEDVAFLHRNGACFRVKDLAEAGARSKTFEISPSGPIFGMKMLVPGGVAGEIERSILERERISPVDFNQLMPKLKLEGGRRPFRVRCESLSWKLDGPDLRIEFFLPKGSYATTLLRELMKNEAVPEGYYEEGEEEKYGLWRPPCQTGTAVAADRSGLPADDDIDG
jgi:tRNA pseudouridine13 synthase